MAPSHILQIFLRVAVQNQIRIVQWVIVDKVVQFRLLRHGHIQCILNPGTINGNFSPIEYKKSEPFSYWKKVRILLLWCGGSGAVRTNLPPEQPSPFSAPPDEGGVPEFFRHSKCTVRTLGSNVTIQMVGSVFVLYCEIPTR